MTARHEWGVLDVRRDPAEIIGSYPEPVSPAALVHPLLTLALALLAHWRGRTTLHGGAFLRGGRAWAISGLQMAGKSSLLAALGARGIPILADDLVVLEGTEVLAGPSCVDLRPDVAARFADSHPMGIVAGRERHRMSTPPGPARTPLGGVFALDWADGEPLTATPLDAGERLALLQAQHYAELIGPPVPEQTLTYLTVPGWRLRRARDWAREQETIDALLAFVDALT